jgi:hypothetical protein
MTKKENNRKKYGLLPPKIAEFDTVFQGHGLCGSGGTTPFTIRTPAKTHSLLALTMIDPATGWFEIVKDTNKSATSIQDLIHNTWLVRYPRPQFIAFDNGSGGECKREFKQMARYSQPQFIVFDNEGKFKREFKQMCIQDNYGIKAKPTTSLNIPSTSKWNY